MRFFRYLCLTALVALAAPPSWAGDAVVTSDVFVDVMGKDGADARSQAMAKGEVDALTELLNKLTAGNGQAEEIVSSLDVRKISALIKATEVLDEKITANRYRAHLMMSFDADEVSALIGKYNTVAGKEESAPATGAFLVIPGYEENGITMLWEEKNAWRDAWKALGLEITSGDIVVPYGDNPDINVIDVKTLASATFASLVPMTIRYGVSDIIILQAKFTSLPDMTLTVLKRRINRTRNEVNMLTYRADPQETRETLLARAARDIAENLQNKKTEELSNAVGVHGGERSKVMVLASITTIASWTQLRAKLTSLPMIDSIEVIALSPQQVDMVVHYRGSADSLANGITSQEIRLVKNKDYWIISRD